jgi:hypothetical protein
VSERLELRVVKLYKKREKVNKICAEQELGMGRLYRILKKYNVPLRRSERK